MTFAFTSGPVALPPVRLIGWFGMSRSLPTVATVATTTAALPRRGNTPIQRQTCKQKQTRQCTEKPTGLLNADAGGVTYRTDEIGIARVNRPSIPQKLPGRFGVVSSHLDSNASNRTCVERLHLHKGRIRDNSRDAVGFQMALEQIGLLQFPECRHSDHASA